MKSPAEIIASDLWGNPDPDSQENFIDRVEHAIKALAEAGYRIVPYDPEQAKGMVGAGGVEMFKCDMAAVPPREATIRIYRAMLDAADTADTADTGNSK